jgi:hypothetical protein
MKTQTAYTKAMTLGPFLTLILLSSGRRGRAASETLRSSSGDFPAVDYAHLATPEEALNQSKSGPSTVGPFLTLILTSGRSQPQASGS